jgi:hypothetical protein
MIMSIDYTHGSIEMLLRQVNFEYRRENLYFEYILCKCYTDIRFGVFWPVITVLVGGNLH